MRIKIFKKLIVIVLLLAVFSVPAIAQKSAADMVLINANILTMDTKKPKAQALAILKNKIIAVGTNAEISRLAGNQTKTIDAKGKLVLPGFNDAHVHFFGVGNMFSSVNLRDAGDVRDFVEKIKYQVKFLPKGRWVLGAGWNNENWSPNAFPTKDLIDDATPDNPVFLYHSNPKIAFANNAALRLAGIDESVKNPSGGEFVRDENGRLTGVLKDSAVDLVRKFVPALHLKDKLAIIESASNYAATYGVTSVQDMSADDELNVYRALEKQGKLKTRVYDCRGLSEWQKAGSPKFNKAENSSMARGGCLKHLAERDFETAEDLWRRLAAADRAGWQIMIHAIGNSAIQITLDGFEKVIKQNGVRDRRLRVEHAHNILNEDISRFGALKIIPSMQPSLFFGGVSDASEPYRALLRSKATLAFGSDSSMIPINPLDGIYAAAIKEDVPNQSVSVAEAVRAYTVGSAFAEFQENQKGSLAVGKLADFIILSDDIFTIPLEKIPLTKVLMTIVDGKIVYEYK